jgi:hypothetical protein
MIAAVLIAIPVVILASVIGRPVRHGVMVRELGS